MIPYLNMNQAARPTVPLNLKPKRGLGVDASRTGCDGRKAVEKLIQMYRVRRTC